MGLRQKITTLDPKKEKRVEAGVLDGDTFQKNVKRSVHFMRVNKSYGMQEVVFQKVCRMGAQHFEIHEKDTGNVHYSTREAWEKHGRVYDYNSGKQRFLGLAYMRSDEGVPFPLFPKYGLPHRCDFANVKSAVQVENAANTHYRCKHCGEFPKQEHKPKRKR